MYPLPRLNNLKTYYLSEHAITIQFGSEIAEELLNRITAFNKLLHQNPFPGFITTVPAYTTLSVFFDPLIVSTSVDLQGGDCFEKVSNYINNLAGEEQSTITNNTNTITIPVCYGNDFGPDMTELSQLHQLDINEIIVLHSQPVYTVYMIGFIPGFAYLGGMSERLASPRKPVPRPAVPAGAIGIAGQQTGIYPMETPGGWQLIGRTPLKLFDATRSSPSLLSPGDQVIFKPVNRDEYNYILNQP